MPAGLCGSVGCASDWRPEGRGFDPGRGQQHSFMEIDHEIFSTVILSLPLIQEGQSVVSFWRKNVHNTAKIRISAQSDKKFIIHLCFIQYQVFLEVYIEQKMK